MIVPDLTITPAGLRVIKLLIGTRPQTIPELVRATGVTRTAVTEQLNDLVSAGLARRHMEHLPGRGRPRHLFSATTSALVLLFAGNQKLVVPAIWRAIKEIGGLDMCEKVVSRVSGILAEHYAARITATTPKERLEQLVRLLCEEGGMLEIREEEGHVSLYKRSCPFISMADEQRNVCAVDLDMISTVVGAEVRHTMSRQEGAPCCVFELVNEAESAG